MADKYFIVEHLTLKEIQRYFSQITIDPTIHYNGVPCWNWQGLVVAKYGAVIWHRINVGIHRLMYAWTIGPLPRGSIKRNGHRLELDHLCRNQTCCNPVHLELVTRQVNCQRRNDARGNACKRGHEYTPENTFYVPRGRGCKICKSQKSADRRAIRAKEEPFFWRKWPSMQK